MSRGSNGPVGSPTPLVGRGETVGVVATGFAVRPAALAAGVARLERMGYRVRLGRSLGSHDGYLAGSDEARLADLCAMIDDAEVRAIWFARGGYGTARLLPQVPWRRLARGRRVLIGYSDLTALFAPALDRAAATCLYAPVVAELGEAGAWHAGSLSRLLAGQPLEWRLRPRQVLVHGRAAGPLAGGNLAVLTHLLGTPYAPRLAGRVLFLEEVAEPVYRIDRMLTQWRAAGALDGLAAVLLGEISVAPRRRFPPDRPLEDVLVENFGELGIPVVRGLRVGHCAGKRSLPLGGRAEIDTRAGRIVLRP